MRFKIGDRVRILNLENCADIAGVSIADEMQSMAGREYVIEAESEGENDGTWFYEMEGNSYAWGEDMLEHAKVTNWRERL